MKKVLSLVLALGLMLSFVHSVGAQQNYEIVLDGEWSFKYYQNAGDVPEDVRGIVFEDKIQVPGAMELQGYGYPSYYYEEMGGWGMPEDDGVRSAGVYRMTFFADGKEGWLKFDSFKDSLTVFLNGERLDESKLGAIGAAFKVTPKKGENELICVVKRDKSGINKEDNFALSGIMGSVKLTEAITVEQAGKKVEVKGNVLTIDGKEVVLKGVKYTPTHPETGDSITDEQIDKDILLIKKYGFNAVWTSCAPGHFYEQAEKAGLYVIDEANVNLDNLDRDAQTAQKRVEEMVERHFGYSSIIMWSVGEGDASRAQNLIGAVKELDSRPVAEEVTFAPDFEVFGNTGGMSDWVKTLGDGNVGGFVDEFADKELYYMQNAYLFDVKDSVTGEAITIDGEVENYKGVQMLGDASYARSIEKLDRYTIVTELSAVGGDRVIFESGSVKLEVRDGRVRFNAGDKRARADAQEGRIAAVYMDGEIQLFANNVFVENAQAEAVIESNYTVGGGDTAIGYIEIYNDALTLDELIEGASEDKLISRVQFEDIDVKEDKSYKFLAYGGDFGDNPNSYYKCLTGIFSSTREPHPEAEAFRLLLKEKTDEVSFGVWKPNEVSDSKVEPLDNGSGYVFASGNVNVVVDYEGRITSIKDNGKELLAGAMYPTVVRDNTISEIEMGVEQAEGWRAGGTRVEDGVLYVELVSTVTEGRLTLSYSMTDDAVLTVSVQSQFTDGATKPTFIGFEGAGSFDNAAWFGSEHSTYPDRIGYDSYKLVAKEIDDMSDNYAIPQENGNYLAQYFTLKNKSDNTAVTFSSKAGLWCRALNYSSDAMEKADHDEDVVKEDKAYFRIGGYIAGVSDNRAYDLNENVYGCTFCIGVGTQGYDNDIIVKINDEIFKPFVPTAKSYVYRTNENATVTAEGQEVSGDEKKATFGDYTIYFAPDDAYLSDMTAIEKSAEVSLDKDFSGNAITMRGNDYWAPAVSYDKGVAIKNGSVTYDVSNMTSHTFSAVVGKNDMDWRRMGGGFDRNMFSASAKVTIALDGEVVYEKADVSMRSGSEEIGIDVSKAEKMTITVTGSGIAPQYEDAVLANAAFVPDGPVVVSFEKVDGKAAITVLNTDEESVEVVLTSAENGIVTIEATGIGKGLYKTVEVKAGDGANVKAYVTDVGELVLE